MGLAEIMSFLKPGITRQFPQDAAQQNAPPMPPEMSVDEVEAALNGAKPSTRKPTYIRSRGPTIDRLTGAAVEQDLPPTYGSSYKDKMRSLMADGNVTGDSNTSPVRVDSNVEFKKPGDPRGSDTGTIVFNQDSNTPGRGGSIFDNARGRDYLTAATLRQEAMDRGETNLPQLPGLRGQGLGTPAGQPVAGGKTDQYNQMKAAQRANQLANEANAPNLIMAREQLRNYGPRGAVMMKMLGGGQGSEMDPALLAASGFNEAAGTVMQGRQMENEAMKQDKYLAGKLVEAGDLGPAQQLLAPRGQQSPTQSGNPYAAPDIRNTPEGKAKAALWQMAQNGQLTPELESQFGDIAKRVGGFGVGEVLASGLGGPMNIPGRMMRKQQEVVDEITRNFGNTPQARKLALQWVQSQGGPMRQSVMGRLADLIGVR